MPRPVTETLMEGERTMRTKMLLAITCFLLLVSTTAADPGDTLWTRTYGGSSLDRAYSVQQTADGGYILAGGTYSFGAGYSDVYLVKTDSSGDTLWTRTYGGSSEDCGWSVQQTSDGGFIAAGYTHSFGAGGKDVYLVKTDPAGDTLWTRTYGGSRYDQGYSVQQTSDSGYIIAGYTDSFGGGNSNVWLLKADSSGDTLWTRTYGLGNYGEGRSIQQTSDGGYVVAGCIFSYTTHSYDVYLLKTDSSGDTLWTRTYGWGDDDEGWSVQQTADGGYIIAGHTYDRVTRVSDVYIVKTDSSGETLWTRTHDRSYQDHGHSVQQASDGGYVIAGYTYSYSTFSLHVYLLKTDASGDTLWTRTYGRNNDDEGWSVQLTSDGGYIIAGYTKSFGAGNADFYLLKVAGEELPVVSIELVPDQSPVVVPRGESFGFTGTVTNNTDQFQQVDIWTMAYVPGIGMYGPLRDYSNVPFNPHQSRSAHLNQSIPNYAPISDGYVYYGYVGEYPAVVIDFSYFPFEVTAKGLAKAGAGDWTLTGSFLEGNEVDLPTEFALSSNYPNPFNVSTVIEYQLPEASEVKLEVYNLLGEIVATLVHEEQQAGYKSISWDASEVSSGLYFYKLSTGDFTKARRMMLVK
jgi:hypothetical protein